MFKLARAILPPMVAAGLMVACYAIAVQAAGATFFDMNTWFKWDGGHYYTIARTGYELRDCAGIPGYHPGQWCGNAAWFPGYPYVAAGLHLLTDADTKLLALFVSQAFGLLALIIVWNGFLSRRNFVALLLCAFAPGTYYFLFVYPISMLMCFILLTLWAQRERHFGLALAAGTVAGFTYPSGVFLSPVIAASLILDRPHGTRPDVRAWLPAAGPLIGFGLVIVVQYVATGYWNAFFLSQEKYKHGINYPWTMLGDRLASLWTGAPGWKIGLQSVLAAVLVLISVRALWRRNAPRGDATLAVHGLLYWVFPLVAGTGLSPSRSETLLLPAVTGLQRLPRLVLGLLVLAAIAVWLIMAAEFARGDLI